MRNNRNHRIDSSQRSLHHKFLHPSLQILSYFPCWHESQQNIFRHLLLNFCLMTWYITLQFLYLFFFLNSVKASSLISCFIFLSLPPKYWYSTNFCPWANYCFTQYICLLEQFFQFHGNNYVRANYFKFLVSSSIPSQVSDSSIQLLIE